MSNNKRILLINSNLVKPPIAPIGLDYIAGALLEEGFEPELLDLNFSEDIEKDIEKKLNSSLLAIGVSVRNTDDCYYLSRDNFLPKTRKIVNMIKRHTSVPVIVGGSGFSVMPDVILNYLGADYGLAGDGEYNLLALVKDLEEKAMIGHWVNRGACRKHGTNLKDGFNNNLDRYPTSFRDFVDNKKYFMEGGMGSIETKRGCDRECIYCADPLIKGKKVRARPVSIVIDEIRNLLAKGIDCLHFCDSEFNIPISHARELLAGIIDKGLGDKVRWYTYMSPVPVDKNLIRKMREAGCVGINFGIDNANLEMLKNLKKKHKPEDIRKVADLCKKYGIKFMFDLLLGGPGEDKTSIKNTIDFVKKLNPTCVGVSYGIRIYPGTYLSKMIKQKHSRNLSLSDSNMFGNFGENLSYLNPVFYISEKIGKEIVEYTNSLVKGDKRFFIGAAKEDDKNYNYNKNQKLQESIKKGFRGAYWDILSQI